MRSASPFGLEAIQSPCVRGNQGNVTACTASQSKSLDTEPENQQEPLPGKNFMGIHRVSGEIQVLWWKVKTVTREVKMNKLYFAFENVL